MQFPDSYLSNTSLGVVRTSVVGTTATPCNHGPEIWSKRRLKRTAVKYLIIQFIVYAVNRLNVTSLWFWVMTPCRLVGGYQRFEETCLLSPSSTLKRWYPPTGVHGVTAQNNIVVFSAEKTSDRLNALLRRHIDNN